MKLTEVEGRLVIIGGAEDREGESVILKEFVKLAGDKKARIVVITAATNHPEESGAEMTKVFKRLGVEKIDVVDVSSRADAFVEKSIERIKQATGLYFTGGDQLNITSLIGGSEMQKAIFEVYEKGCIIAGTSAGAAMMSNSMIMSGSGEQNPQFGKVDLAPGMDFVRGSIIDTHFSQRGRHGRLLAAVAHHPQELGIGIDEDTAMIVHKNEFYVKGSGAVTLFDSSSMSYSNTPYVKKGDGLAMSNVKVHVLPENYKFDLEARCMIAPEKSEMTFKASNANENTKEKK
jgi:cyanophycinase